MKKIIFKRNNIWCGFFLLLLISGCDKEFLDAKPDKSLLIPESLQDFRALLDNVGTMNLGPSLGTISADEFILADNALIKLTTPMESGCYFFKDDLYQGASPQEWSQPYIQIFYSNVVLEGILKLKTEMPDNQESEIKGSALFYRAFALYNLSQLFAKPYDPKTALTDMGLPIPLSSNINLRPGRGSLADLYSRIITDLKESTGLLPVKVLSKNRPNKQAAYGVLARIYLVMGDFQKALEAANTALTFGSDIINFNTLNLTSITPFGNALPNNISELIYFVPRTSYGFLNNGSIKIDPELLSLYDPNDLRLKIYTRDNGMGLINLKVYEGLATDEILLIKAECLARAQDGSGAVDIINRILINRFPLGKFTPVSGADSREALDIVLRERRRELFARGLRWSDLRRLNLEGKFTKTIVRIYNGIEIARLEPNSLRYTLSIPDNEILLSKIQQNPR